MPVGDGLIREVHRQRVAFFFFRALEEFLDLVLGKGSGKNAVLEAVVVENVRVARRDDHAEAIVFHAPGCVLAAGAAAEVMARQQDRRAFIARKIQHKLRIRFLAWQIAPIIKQDPAKSLSRQRLQELLWHHLVRVHIDFVQRRDHPGMRIKWFHSIRAPQKSKWRSARLDYSTEDTSSDRTSTKWPAMAAAAAITGLTRCVRLSLPWRPSKLRLDVLALRSCGGRTSAFIPMHMLQPASRHSKPASRKILSRPSSSACALIPREPGTISACLMLCATCLPATRCAAARKSSNREFVHEPINTRSTGMSTIAVPAFNPMYFSALSVAF